MPTDLGTAPHVDNVAESAGTRIHLDHYARVVRAKTAQRLQGVPAPAPSRAPRQAARESLPRRLARPVLRVLRYLFS